MLKANLQYVSRKIYAIIPIDSEVECYQRRNDHEYHFQSKKEVAMYLQGSPKEDGE